MAHELVLDLRSGTGEPQKSKVVGMKNRARRKLWLGLR